MSITLLCSSDGIRKRSAPGCTDKLACLSSAFLTIPGGDLGFTTLDLGATSGAYLQAFDAMSWTS